MTRRETVLKWIEEQKDFMNTTVSHGIEDNRKGYARVAFVDKDENPVNDVNFKAVQKSHDFNFGCNMFLLDEFETEEKNAEYRRIFPKVFNYAVAPFYWDALEPSQGEPRYDKNSPKIYRRPVPDLVLEYCKKNGIRVKGHCIVYDRFRPQWLADDIPNIKRQIEAHFAELAQRYGDIIQDWDIINETLSWTCYNNNRVSKFFREDDYISFSFECAKRHMPLNRKFINEANGIWENFHFSRSAYYLLLKSLIAEGIDFDAVGIQCHQFVQRSGEESYAADRYNPERVYDVLNTLGRFNKPLQISEITIDSYNGDSEDMDIQAELIENMYKVWFSHKNMDGIVYWNLVDGYTFNPAEPGAGDMSSGENQFGGALLFQDLSPKPAFKTLDRLINREWHTEGVFSTGTDKNTARFKGFKGMYDIEVSNNGKTYTKELHLDGRSDCDNIIVLD